MILPQFLLHHVKTMNDFNVEYRSVIKFIVMENTHTSEFKSQPCSSHGDRSPSKATIYRWVGEFKRGRASVFDEDRTVQPVEIVDQILKKSRKIIADNRNCEQKILKFGTHVI